MLATLFAARSFHADRYFRISDYAPAKTSLTAAFLRGRFVLGALFLCGAFVPFSQAQAAPCAVGGDGTFFINNTASCEISSVAPLIGNNSTPGSGSIGFYLRSQTANRVITIENDLTTTLQGVVGINVFNEQTASRSLFDASGRTINLTITNFNAADSAAKSGVSVFNGSTARIGTLNLTMNNLPVGNFITARHEHYGVLTGSTPIRNESAFFDGNYSSAIFDNLDVTMSTTGASLMYPLLVGIRAIQGAGAGANAGHGSAGYVEVAQDLRLNISGTSGDAMGIYISGTEQAGIVPEVHLNNSDITIKSTSQRSAAIRLGKTNNDGVGTDVGIGLGTLYSTGHMELNTLAMTNTSAASIVSVWEGSLLDAGASTASTTIQAANTAINVSGDQDTTGAVKTQMLFNDLVVTTASTTANLVNVTSGKYLLDVHGAGSNLTASAGGFLVNVTGATTDTEFNLAQGTMTGLVNKATTATTLLNMNVSNGAEWVLAAKGGTNPTTTATFTQLNLSNTAQVNAYGDGTGSAAFTLLGNVTNSGGLINLSNAAGTSGAAGVVGDTLTIRGNYVGSNNGMVVLDTFLGDDTSPSDKLIIDNGTASGTTALFIKNAGGPGALTTANGILVVEAINGATTTDAFTLANPGGYVAAGAYAYTLHYRDAADLGENWFLRATIDCIADPTNPVCPSGTDTDIRPEVSLYAANPDLALTYGRALLNTLHERTPTRPEQYAPGQGTCDEQDKNNWSGCDPNIVWLRALGGGGSRDGGSPGIYGSRGPSYDYDYTMLQIGVDLLRQKNAEGDRNHFGGYYAYGNMDADVDDIQRSVAGETTLIGHSLGLYYTHFAPEGGYIDAVLQGTWYEIDSNRRASELGLRSDGLGIAASLEGGYPFWSDSDKSWGLEPQAQLIYQTINLDGGREKGTTTRVSYDDVESLQGRLGLRLVHNWKDNHEHAIASAGSSWLRLSVLNEFIAQPKTRFSFAGDMVAFKTKLTGSSVELRAGFDGWYSGVGLYANLGATSSLNGQGYIYDGRLGIKVPF
ncbi:MAG: autotransporter outer membrane beta-barrel domain-containing protein [Methylobacillus sp.]|jgi:outer membrane autotransporter protein|nr:autotransporter outer membrane beta-barrel domain-containing protein [Methylobacillus sp.]